MLYLMYQNDSIAARDYILNKQNEEEKKTYSPILSYFYM